jgi:hypothetical protein
MHQRCLTGCLPLSRIRFLMLGLCAWWIGRSGFAAPPSFDFLQPQAAAEWTPVQDTRLRPVPAEGLSVEITGPDPYLHGPARDYPVQQPLWLRLRVRSDAGGPAQLFWFGAEPAAEERSVRFTVPAGPWVQVQIPVPPLGPATRLRLDPPGNRGTFTLERMEFTERNLPTPPSFPPPPALSQLPRQPSLRSGALALYHSPAAPGAFRLDVDGRPFAQGHAGQQLGYVHQGQTRWLSVAPPDPTQFQLQLHRGRLDLTWQVRDPEGGQWRWRQSFRTGPRPGRVEIETQVEVERDRDVLFLPLFTVLPGAGSFGTNQTQALLAGVEYLEHEPSSSEKDLIGPQARRLVPDALKLTFPLAALHHDQRWLALSWDRAAEVSILHDSPDRTYGSGGHAWTLLFPGSDPAHREDGALLPYHGTRLTAGRPLRHHAALMGGRGDSVVPAIQAYVERSGLPPLPRPGLDARSYFQLAARGWLDSGIRSTNHYRHAVGASFPAGPAADAAALEEWLAPQVLDPDLAQRLTEAAAGAWSAVPEAERQVRRIGHLRDVFPAWVSRQGPEATQAAGQSARQALERIRPDGTVRFQPAGPQDRLGTTHHEDHANGLTAAVLAQAFDQALLAGDRALIDRCLAGLEALPYRAGVPRGAQTWEIPLHTPDLLASAHLMHCYTLGYELTGNPRWLEAARYWAWTGVSFVHLTAAGPGPVGAYSTIPVLGATQFVAPNWIGLPVQWCGLVYGEALRHLARHDRSGPWIQLANGIALAGIQHTHPFADGPAQGCLPDAFELRAQQRNPVPINPGTLLPQAAIALGQDPLWDRACFRKAEVWVLAPGPIQTQSEATNSLRFRVQGWPRHPYQILIAGRRQLPEVRINRRQTPVVAPHRWEAESGRLWLELEGAADVQLTWR